MPDFTQWNVPSPFPNILFNPAAVDAAIAKTQSELGNLDINRQTLALEQDKAAREKAFGEGLLKAATDGTTGATVGPLADAAPDQTRDAAGQESYNFWVGKGLAPHQAAGMAAQEVAESGGRPNIWGDNREAYGLYQHHSPRRQLILANTGIDITKADANQQREAAYWELMNSEHGARKLLFAATDPDQAGRAATEFERPDSKRRAIIDAERGRDARRIFQLANPNGAASVATATVDPRAGPRAGLAPPPSAVATAPSATPTTPTTPTVTPPGVNPNAEPRAGTVPPTTTTGQADDANTAAVKQAATALLNMPEPDAAAAYPAVVKELQARGFAMNAPTTYPGHAALQALVGGGDAVAQTKTAMRLGGTDVADASGVVVPTAAPAAPRPYVILDESGKPLLAPPPAANKMMAGVGLPGVTIGLPQNGLAPQQQQAAAPVTTAAAPAAPPAATRPPLEAPPAAPTRVIPREPTIQSGVFAGLTRTQATNIAQAAAGGAKPAQVMEQIATARHQNDVIRQGDATQAAIEQQANYERQEAYRKAQIEAEKTQYERGRNTESDARAAETARIAREKAEREAKLAGQPIQGTEISAQHENTLLTIGPKIKAGTATPEEQDTYASAYYAAQQAGAQTVTITDPNNQGQTIPAMIPRRLPATFPEPSGGALPPVIATPGAGKQEVMSDAQAGAAGFADRMRAAEPIMHDLDNTAVSWSAKIGEKAGDYVGYNLFNSPEYQRLRTAQEAFLVGILRKESGAAISPSEWDRYAKMYFPQPGNDAETIKLKQQFRQAAIDGMTREAGPTYKPPAATPPPAQAAPQAAPAAPMNPAQRTPNTVYSTPKGDLKWTGTGWLAPAGVQ